MQVDSKEAVPTQATNVSCSSPDKQSTLTAVPSSKGHRPWKEPKKRTAAAQRRTASLKLTLEQKQHRREKQESLMRIVKAAKEADITAKQEERKRLADRKRQKEENERRGTQQVLITNPKKLARMSKKQYLNYVKKNNIKK